jgi:HD-GYP domain-containing protein (c-di-GMP phosphodiesterase class II)
MSVHSAVVKENPIGVFSRESFLTERDVYQYFVDLVVDQTKSEIGYFHLFDHETEEISLGVWSGKVFDQCATTHVSHYPLRDAGIWADSIRQGRGIYHNDYMNLHHRNQLPEGHFPISNHLSAPIYDPLNKTVIGIIGIGNRPHDYSQADIDHLESMILEGWSIIEVKVAEIHSYYSGRAFVFKQKQPEDLLSEMIATIGKVLELRDEYTSRHQSNVSLICDRIAERLGLPRQQRFGLKLGSSIHDLGKIGVPSELLTKPNQLHPAEFELIKTHAEIGANIFKGHDLPWPIEQMIEQHHERMDGSGYPKGILGQSICMEARIIAVADTFDAISSDRPYRFAPGPEQAIQILKQERGIKFDTYVVDMFLEIIEDDESLRLIYFKE